MARTSRVSGIGWNDVQERHPTSKARRRLHSPTADTPGASAQAPSIGARSSMQDLYGNARLQGMLGGQTTRPGDASEREADAAASAVMAGETPEVGSGSGFALAGSWLGDAADWLGDRVGDALDMRDDEERLDAEEDLADFMDQTYSEDNVIAYHSDSIMSNGERIEPYH